MAAAESQGRVVFGPARRIAGRIPPTLELVDVLVANVEPQHAAPLVKVLARELPLRQLQHLKRVRRRDGCKGAVPQMQLILHTVSSLRALPAAGEGAAAKRIGNGAASTGVVATAGGAASSGDGGNKTSTTPAGKSTPPAAPNASDGGSAGSTCTCFAAHHTHRHPTTHVVPPATCTGRCSACNGTATSNGTPTGPQQQKQQQSPAASSPAAATAARAPLRSATQAAADVERFVPPRIATALVTAGAVLDVAQVPGVAPDNRDQWTEWSKIWPMPWKLPSGQPHQDGQTATATDQAYFEAHMSRVIAMSAAAGGANVCVIVNPANGEIIAEAVDNSAKHPLKHASMQAVSAAAERDLRLWPVNGFVHLGRQEDTSVHGVNTILGGGAAEELVGSNGGSASGDEGQQQQVEQQQELVKPPEHLIAGLKHCHSQDDGLGVDSPAKRQRVTTGASNSCSFGEFKTNGQPQEQEEQEQEQQNGTAKPAKQQQQHEEENGRESKANGVAANGTAQHQQQRPPRQSSSTPSLDSAASGGRSVGGSRVPTPIPISSWANKPYLCNTYDAFLLREPCAMCGMALVHSRLERVVYCDMDPAHGALGGAFRLQANRSLNHHYDVFHMPLDRSGGANGAAHAADGDAEAPGTAA